MKNVKNELISKDPVRLKLVMARNNAFNNDVIIGYTLMIGHWSSMPGLEKSPCRVKSNFKQYENKGVRKMK